MQVAGGSTLIQDTKEVAVHGTLSLLLSRLRGEGQTIIADPKGTLGT